MLENIEVVNFIERWKGQCDNFGSSEYPASASNSTISRLVCEEARYRWVGMAHQERITVDDVSCVVINFSVDENKDSVVAGEGEEKLVKIDATNYIDYDE